MLACRELGADRAIDYTTEDFVAVIERETGGQGVDVILDMVGGDYINRNLQCLAVEGRLVQIAFLKGAKAEINSPRHGQAPDPHRLDAAPALGGAEGRHRPGAARRRSGRWSAAGKVRPQIHATFPLAQAAEAHRLMESSAHIGKIVLTFT